MSRFALRISDGVSSRSVADWKRSWNRCFSMSLRVTVSCSSLIPRNSFIRLGIGVIVDCGLWIVESEAEIRLFSFRNLQSAIRNLLNVGPPRHEAALKRHLVRHTSKTVLGGAFRQTANLKQNLPGTDNRGPVLRFALTLTHPRFGGDGGNGLVRENTNVVTTFAGNEPRHGHAAALDAFGGEPAAFERLQTEVAVGDVVPAVRVALDRSIIFLASRPPAHNAALALAELDSFGHLWHRNTLPSGRISLE